MDASCAQSDLCHSPLSLVSSNLVDVIMLTSHVHEICDNHPHNMPVIVFKATTYHFNQIVGRHIMKVLHVTRRFGILVSKCKFSEVTHRIL